MSDKLNLPAAFGECDRCGGVLLEGTGTGKHARLHGLSADTYDALRAEHAAARPAPVLTVTRLAALLREVLEG